MERKPRLLFVATEDWYFHLHFLSWGRAARDKGFDVVVAARVNTHREQIEKEGFKLIPIPFIRRSKNVLHELLTLYEIMKIYRRERPDIVLNIGIKPVLYGTWASKLARIPIVINLLAGITEKFHENEWISSLIRHMVNLAYRWGYKGVNPHTIFQNPADIKIFLDCGIAQEENVHLIRGCGVDTNRFNASPEPQGTPIVLLASRMIWEKGVGEFVEAARILQRERTNCRMVLVGDCDPDSTGSVPKATLEEWNTERVIEWWGPIKNMPDIFSQIHIVCLPSYHEGAPMVLLEGASCGRPIVTTDVPGCRQIVKNNEGGLSVPIKNPEALAKAIKTLVESKDLREKMGKRGRQIILEEFSVEIVIDQTIALYEKLMKTRGISPEASAPS